MRPAVRRSNELRTETADSFAALSTHLAAWDRLAWKAPQKLPTLLPSWIDAFLRHRLRPNERWLCCFAYADDRLVGVLPVIITPHQLLGGASPVLRTPCDAHTPSGDVLIESDCTKAAFRALLVEVGRQVPHHLGLELKAVRKSSPLWDVLQHSIDGYVVRPGLRSLYSFLDVRGDFNNYLHSLGKMRRNLRVGRKKLESRGRVSVALWRASNGAEDFLPQYLDLEAAGWKGRNGTAMRNNPGVVDFYTTLIRNFAAQGRWEWHVIRVDERIVAAQMGIRCGAAIMLPKYAFDEDFAECMPGSLLLEETFREAFSRPEVDELNPMSSSDAHRLWHMPRDEYIDVHLVRKAALPVLIALPHIAMRSLYQVHVRPRIPAAVKRAYRKYQRRGGRKPRRAAENRSKQQ